MKVAIIMGSESDFDVVAPARDILENFGVTVDVRVISAHRTPEIAFDFAKNAEENGYELIIGAAGKAAHLPGVLAGISTLPVIGIPIKSSFEDGMDSLLSIVQMPNGVPVATVAVNGSLNAGLLAVQMLAIKYDELKSSFKAYKEEMRDSVIKQNENIQGR